MPGSCLGMWPVERWHGEDREASLSSSGLSLPSISTSQPTTRTHSSSPVQQLLHFFSRTMVCLALAILTALLLPSRHARAVQHLGGAPTATASTPQAPASNSRGGEGGPSGSSRTGAALSSKAAAGTVASPEFLQRAHGATAAATRLADVAEANADSLTDRVAAGLSASTTESDLSASELAAISLFQRSQPTVVNISHMRTMQVE